MTNERAHWGSRLGFILAAAGSAVGLGNIWKFPYITGENGGGLFVLIYLVCIALVGIPIMMAEIMIGRAAQKQPVAAFHELQQGKSPWAGIGWMGIVAGFLILSFYIVVAGWAMDYTLKSFTNFTAPIHAQAEQRAMEYRMTASREEMQQRLIQRTFMKDDVYKQAIKDIWLAHPPSVSETYNQYVTSLMQSGVLNVPQAEAVQRAWQNVDEDTLALAGMSQVATQVITEEQRAAYRDATTRLMRNDEYAAHLTAASELYDDLALAEKDAMLRAVEEIRTLAQNETALLERAEALERRTAVSEQVNASFGALASDGVTSTFWSAIFMFITIIIVAGGIAGGIERTCRILMPTLIVLMLVMVGFGATQSGFGEALSFVFKPDVEKLEPSGVLEALGHAFFTLSLGMGAMITYGSYQREKTLIVQQSIAIALLDTAVALLACMMMFPIIFTFDQDAGAGPGLVFMSMPLAFSEIGAGGMFLAILFFGLLVFAALTSSISLLEVVASYFMDERGWSRRKAAWTIGGVIFAVSLPVAFSMDSRNPMPGWEESTGMNFFDTMDYLTSNWMLPLGGLLIAIYAGWIMPRRMQQAEVGDVNSLVFQGWLVLVRFVAPILVIIVLLQKIGLIDANEVMWHVLH